MQRKQQQQQQQQQLHRSRSQIDILTANYILMAYAYPILSTDSIYYYLTKEKKKKSAAIPLLSELPPLLSHDHCLAS